MQFSFLHLADIHFGRSFGGLTSLMEDNSDILKECSLAVKKSFQNVVDFAIEKNVDFLLIAGDTFDSVKHDLNFSFFFAQQLSRLEKEKIFVYMICGNHDPLYSYKNFFNVYDFKDSKYIKIVGLNTNLYDEFVFQKNDINLAKIHALSFEKDEFLDNPIKSFPKSDNLLFNIGLLHCDLDVVDSPYAPCLKSDLEKMNYSYWALGHIHLPCKDETNIQYCGTLQGRNFKEIGAHGARLITVCDNQIVNKELINFDTIRYEDLTIDISDCFDIFQIKNEISKKIDLNQVELCFLRLTLIGVNNFDILLSEINFDIPRLFVAEIKDLTAKNVDLSRYNDEILDIVMEKSSNKEYVNTQLDQIISDDLKKLIAKVDINVDELFTIVSKDATDELNKLEKRVLLNKVEN